jgi:Protein of unknown function (DUF1706)
MAEVTREQTLDALQNGWATYIDRFHALPTEAQEEFLQKQGYTRFADLLAHVTAWWEEGEMVINGLLKDAGYRWASYDVDAFNAQAVRRFSDHDEPAVANSFNLARISFVALVSSLPEDAFSNKKILSWLYADVVEHLQDHAIP